MPNIVDTFVPTEDGRWVSENFVRLNEVIKEYDPNLFVGYLDAEYQKTPFLRENCFMVYDRSRNAPAFYFSPKEPPAKVLAKVFRIDTRKNDVLGNIEADERAAEILRLKAQIESQGERKELATWLVGAKQNYPQFKPPGEDKVVKFDDQLHRL